MMAPETMVRKALVGEPTVCFERGDLFWSVFQGLGSWVESLKLLDIRRERAVCRRRADSVSFLGDSRSGCLCGEESKPPPPSWPARGLWGLTIWLAGTTW